jgi:hypothetical protein
MRVFSMTMVGSSNFKSYERRIFRARSFLMNVVKIYKERFADATRMLGDQLSLAAILLENSNSRNVSLLFKKPAMFMAQISDVQVLFLPSQDYNWTPSEGAGQFHGMPDSVKVRMPALYM